MQIKNADKEVPDLRCSPDIIFPPWLDSPSGPNLIVEVSKSHSDTPHLVGFLWSQRPISDNTQHSLKTDIHVPVGIRTYNPSKQGAAYPRHIPRGPRNGPLNITQIIK